MQMIAFYQTSAAKKAVQRMPVLAAKGAELTQKRVQKRLPELGAAILAQARDKKKPQRVGS